MLVSYGLGIANDKPNKFRTTDCGIYTNRCRRFFEKGFIILKSINCIYHKAQNRMKITRKDRSKYEIYY